jgi:hypothetical protein
MKSIIEFKESWTKELVDGSHMGILVVDKNHNNTYNFLKSIKN